MHEGHLVDARAERRDDFVQHLAALPVGPPFPGRAKRGAEPVLKQLDVFARVPLLAIALMQERFVVERVEMTGPARHEELDHPLGLGRMMQSLERAAAPRLAARRQETVPAEQMCERDSAQPAAEFP